MSKSAFFKQIVREITEAGCQYKRQNNSHLIYRGLTGATVTVPKKLDDRNVYLEIRKRAGLTP